MAKSCLGLDIGSFSIKIAALERQESTAAV